MLPTKIYIKIYLILQGIQEPTKIIKGTHKDVVLTLETDI